MIRVLFLVPALVVAGLLMPSRVEADEFHHARIHQALYDIKEAIKELDKTDRLGEHKVRAIRDLRAAEVQIVKGLEACKDPWKADFRPNREHMAALEKFKDFRHLRHSEEEIAAAITELKDAKGWGEHREKALRDLEAALVQVKLCIKELK
jgi:hypothetical protein